MALIECPDCGKKVSDAAPACIHCGRPMAAVSKPSQAQAPVAPVGQGRTSGASYVCRNCGSTDVRKLSVVHASGVTSVTMETTGSAIGMTGGGNIGVGFGSATSSGIQQTALSESVAPPAQRKPTVKAAGIGCSVAVFALIIGAATGSFTAFAIILISSLVVLAVLSSAEKRDIEQWNSTEWPILKAKWDRSLLCMRCGKVFELEETA